VLDTWRAGQLSPTDFDEDVRRCRRAWASISGVDPATVAVGSTVSAFVGLVAAGLPDGARVVTAAGEFTSLLFPFLAHADRGVTVEELPLDELAAFTSADGRVTDLGALRIAADAAGARLLVDTTQSCGWLPVDGSRLDYTVCGAYKWLLCPRGTAFLSVRPDAMDGLRPLAAGWYAGDDMWDSIYGSPLRLAQDARRFDISPAWFAWAGAVEGLELLAGLDREQVQGHNVRLANRFLERLGQPAQDSAIVTVARPGAEELLRAAGVRTAVRNGRVRASFHLYNDDADVDLAVRALTG
jgi:selenocysteine lyase/cysteine desulfurase